MIYTDINNSLLDRSFKVAVLSSISTGVCFAFILANGVRYVNTPKLIPRTEIISYSGPGHESSRNGRGWGPRALLGKEGLDEKKRLD